jgi:hypothetical protein
MGDVEFSQEEERVKRQERLRRREKLWGILKSVLSGQFESNKPPIQFRFDSKTDHPREKYISPKDRSSFNYGWTPVNEMQAGSENY